METIIPKITEWLALYGTKIIGAIALLLIGRWVAGWLSKAVEKLMSKGKTDETLIKFVSSLVRIGLITFVIIAAMGMLGIQTTSFVAVIGAAGLAIGFALQGSLANFASGVLLLLFKPFKAGDYVEAGGTAGIVEEVSIFNTFFKTPDNRKVIVPNAKITGDNIINYTAKETRRLDMVFGIGYGDDIKKAKDVIEKILSENSKCLKDPVWTIGVLELGDSSVNLAVRPWVKTAEYWDAYFDLHEKIKIAFDKAGISIPFPQTDVHFYPTSSAFKTETLGKKEISQ